MVVVRNQVLEPSASASWGVYEQGAAHGRNQGSDLGTVLWKATSQPAAYLLGQVHAPVCFFSPPPKNRCKYMCVCVCMHISFSVCLCIIMPHEHLTCSLPWIFFKSYALFHVCKILPIRGTTTKMSILSL